MDDEQQGEERCVEATADVALEDQANASGNRQELERNFNLLSICGIAITTGESWIALGNSMVCTSATTFE